MADEFVGRLYGSAADGLALSEFYEIIDSRILIIQLAIYLADFLLACSINRFHAPQVADDPLVGPLHTTGS